MLQWKLSADSFRTFPRLTRTRLKLGRSSKLTQTCSCQLSCDIVLHGCTQKVGSIERGAVRRTRLAQVVTHHPWADVPNLLSVDGDGVHVADVYPSRGGHLIWHIHCPTLYFESYMSILAVNRKNSLFINGILIYLIFFTWFAQLCFTQIF